MSDPILKARLTNIVLTTQDLDGLETFYRDTFGFEVFHRDGTCRFLRTGATNLVLLAGEGLTQGICLDVSVPDLDVAGKALTDAGISFDRPDPSLMALRDPDGNLVEIVRG